MKKNVFLFFLTVSLSLFSQGKYWQQYVHYDMNVDMDVKKHTYSATQKVDYVNHSPDTLQEIYYHLYWNVFKPGSSLYWHEKGKKDSDGRVMKLAKLKPEETGHYQIEALTQNGQTVAYEITESVMRVKLNKPIAPGERHVFEMKYTVQIPKLIRRSGRDNEEGIDYSMAQWYPKIAEYRPDGWHADPFLGREFFGVWGDFDVTIHIDKNYVVGGTGYLQNAEEIWEKSEGRKWKLKPVKGNKRTWKFTAPTVHDFSWAADPDYVRESFDFEGTELNFYYIPKGQAEKKWHVLQDYTAKTLNALNQLIGPYPYKQYSVIQAGDGGMEYAMCTFITGNRSEASLVGVMMHEFTHSWFQFVLATDETRHPWMDEGFTTFVSTWLQKAMYEKKEAVNYWTDMLETYFSYVDKDAEEPVSIYSDFYITNMSYWVNAYDKGGLFLMHLVNIAGTDKMVEFLRNYYKEWKFKHPEPEDMLRVAEKTTGMELDWLYNQWMESTHHVDYAIKKVESKKNATKIVIEKRGSMPNAMNVYILMNDKERSVRIYHIPYFRTLKYREVPGGEKNKKFKVLKPWYDGFPEYQFEIPFKINEIYSVVIDPFYLTGDIDPENNLWKADKKNKKK